MSKTCFCGLSEHCGYQIETDMVQHDKLIYEQGYNKAIDEFSEWLKKRFPIADNGLFTANYKLHITIDEIAEQLKGEKQ